MARPQVDFRELTAKDLWSYNIGINIVVGGMMETGSDRSSFLAGLLKKQSDTKRMAEKSGRNFSAATHEAERQISEVITSLDGNIISGEGVTKSGGDD